MKKIILFAFLFLVSYLKAQINFVDYNFNLSGNGSNAFINDTEIQTDGKIIIAGDFTSFNGVTCRKIVRLDVNGNIDYTFNAVINEEVYAVEIQSDGKILVGGIFDSINNVPRYKIARLNSDGTLDLSFNPGQNFINSLNYGVSKIELYNNSIIVGGGFETNNLNQHYDLIKLNSDGTFDNTFISGESFAGGSISSIKVMGDGSILIAGGFSSYNNIPVATLIKINSNGTLDNSFVTLFDEYATTMDIELDQNENIFVGGFYSNNWNFNYGVLKLDAFGNIDNSFSTGSTGFDLDGLIYDMKIKDDNIYVVGYFDSLNGRLANSFVKLGMDGSHDSTYYLERNILSTLDISQITFQNENIILSGALQFESQNRIFKDIMRLKSKNCVTGKVVNDINLNCSQDFNEGIINGISLIINPGSILVNTDFSGYWRADNLLPGIYNISIDTTNMSWTPLCLTFQNFDVPNTDSLIIVPDFVVNADEICASPTISIIMPSMRPCFTNQQVYVQACNEYDATGILPDAYSIVELDPSLIFESASLPYTSLGNNQYRFEHDSLYPGECVNYTISTQVDCNAPLGLTLCLEANLYPVVDCVLDTIPTPPTGDVTPCTLPWDQSSLSVEGWCANDSIYFTITNTGQLGGGDMECYSPVRVFVDGVPYLLDSIMLLGGETFTYVFAGNGATWILEADQHPLHPGNSHPNAHVENCNPGNWTPDIVNNFPTDDADPVKDIYCNITRSSYDPNDKKGTPYGLGAEHEVLPNQDIEYLIRFQNTGTDTAFTVVVRDTLDLDFDIFSVTAGSASHNYSFRMYGPRVLEWTFSNILLPDSTTNEVASHGFLSYRVKQKPNLSDGTLLTNDADIYFDFNAPIITNETSHKVQRRIFEPTNSLVSLSQTKTGIKLYPNPTKQETTLSFSTYQKQVSYKLMNLSGQVILEKSNLYGKEVKVNLSEIPNGMYLMELKTTQGNEIVKVMKE